MPFQPECIPCRTHAGRTPVTPLVYANFEGWRALEAQRSKGPCVKITILLRQDAKEHRVSYIHANRRANSTPEIFGPRCMECTLAFQKMEARRQEQRTDANDPVGHSLQLNNIVSRCSTAFVNGGCEESVPT